MIETKFIEDAHDHAPDLVAAATGTANGFDEHVQCLLVVACIARRESLS